MVIVGAGMAGLHCAYRLFKDSGIHATVYEAQKRIGGRMLSDRNTFKDQDGMHCELGGELIDTPHTVMQDLAKELGLELLDYHNEDATLDHLKAHVGGKLYGSADLLQDWAPVAAKIDEAAKVITDTDLYPTHRNPAGGEALDKTSLRAFFDSIGLTKDTVLGKVMEIAFVTEYGLELDQQSALNFLYIVDTSTDKLEQFGQSDERFHTKTGNDSFIQKLAAALPSDAIKLEHTLKKVTKGSDGRYVATFDKAGSSVEVKADHLVLTLPFTVLRDVDLSGLNLPPLKKKAIAELGYGSNAKLMVGFDGRPWRDAKAGGEMYSDLGFQCAWETSRLQSKTSKAGILTNFTGGKHGADDVGKGTPEQRASEFVGWFDAAYPGSKAAYNKRVARFHWPSNPWVKGSYQCYLVGQYTSIRGLEGERFENVHFCGEHTSLGNAGFMEGSAETGADVAADIAKDMGASSGDAKQARWLRNERRAQVAAARRARLWAEG